MEQPPIPKSTIKALARLAGIDLTDEKLEETLPLILMQHEASVRLRKLDLNDAEPSSVFVPRTG